MELTRRERKNWIEPFDWVTDLQDDMNRLFTTSLRRKRSDGWLNLFEPDLDIAEEENHYTVHADLPGLKKEDVDISVTGNVLTIKGERKEEIEKKNKNAYHSERRFGQFQRVLEFPAEIDADQIKATYKEGVLELTIPKSERAKPKQIKVDVK